MDLQGTINAVGDVLLSNQFCKAGTNSEEFAQKRFFKKLERPDTKTNEARRQKAWVTWYESDESLRTLSGLFNPNWAKARLLLHEILKDFHLGPVSFTNGSEFVPTRGFNSVESKLSKSVWTCTHDNFDLWLNTVFSHRALKVATRRRYAELLARKGINQKKLDRSLWERYKNVPNFRRHIFGFKLWLITELVHGNRFTTVRKNNDEDRPVCPEPLANILTQRRIGLGIRECLKTFGVDLDFVAEKHRVLISKSKYATIDLKNASDRISIRLVKYLLPNRVFNFIMSARSAMTLGLDDQFYWLNKISSMGNGFTFELMSLLLYALCQANDKDSSVFGDDIIVPNSVAPQVIADLQNGGFLVNVNKTHINSKYRESCGAHYNDEEGYIESYDIEYPTSVGNLITLTNKLNRLSNIYPSFVPLFLQVYRLMPATLYAENPIKADGFWRRHKELHGYSFKLDDYMVKSRFQYRKDGLPINRRARSFIRRYCHRYQLDPRDASMHYAYQWEDDGRAPTSLKSSEWAKILMYIASGRRCKDTVRGCGVYKSYLVVTLKDGTTVRWSDLVAQE